MHRDGGGHLLGASTNVESQFSALRPWSLTSVLHVIDQVLYGVLAG
jgi:hypothetical protein